MKKTLCLLLFTLPCVFANASICSKLYGAHTYFMQPTIKDSPTAFSSNHTKTITALIRNAKFQQVWRTYRLTTLPSGFLHWNIGARIKMLQNIQEGKMPHFAISSAHGGIVASYAIRREDSLLKLNNAVKGLGYLPKPSQIDNLTKLLQNTMHEPMAKKLIVLENIYNQANRYFDMSKLTSLELYTNRDHCTQTFLNQYYNPISTITFLAIPNYKLKTVVILLDPANPNLTPDEKKIVTYVNLAHEYFHHDPHYYVTVVYNIIEVYNNTPGEQRKIR